MGPNLKVIGISPYSAGDIHGAGKLASRDAGCRVHKKRVVHDNRITGAALYGDTMDGARHFQIDMRRQRNRRIPRTSAVRSATCQRCPTQCRGQRHRPD